MREILFKAKRIDNGKWVEGYYYKMSETTYCFKEDYERKPVPEHHYILQERITDWGLPNRIVQIEIDPETLCQFTGLYDKNGKKIWENDIFQYTDEITMITNKDLIKYNETHASFVRLHNTGKLGLQYLWIDEAICNHGEVIGNIFDNKELLQEKRR